MRAVLELLRRRSLGALAVLCLGLVVSGCGPGPGFKPIPVSGKVFVDGELLTDGHVTVLFRPYASKGNPLKLDFSGTADKQGTYRLHYGSGDRGAAPGWYKVAVVATEPYEGRKGPGSKTKRMVAGPPVRKSLIDKKYTLPTTSGIEFEVVENPAPGAYDLQLTGVAKK
jgi:hypothetical protein